MGYLKNKPGSIEELASNMTKQINDSSYQDKFKKELDKAGRNIGSMTPKEKAAFFNKVDDIKKTKDEQWGARTASGGTVGGKKHKKEDVKNEADERGDAVNKHKAKVGGEKKPVDPKPKITLTGSKATKVEVEPEVDYKN